VITLGQKYTDNINQIMTIITLFQNYLTVGLGQFDLIERMITLSVITLIGFTVS